MPEILKVERILEYSKFPFNWYGIEVSLDDVKLGIQKGVVEVYERFPDRTIERLKDLKTKVWHIGRIIYFVNHPEKILPIGIKSHIISDGSLIPWIYDGNHRFMAAVVRGDEIIHGFYRGSTELLNYLKGVTSVKP
ncbi:hypothetical protein [Pelotomaculum propionicicum]|uniref:Uncharacterized protein n=1 Tax=Pelotomaculum propionicicum TaxID=258475 RepID=A0A4Y7RV08_9FIRM|nr:hypothetical protein [Pelotomaculum propionicicum]TEB12569.1 hypothetical protein Pmgp_00900 [Pelotomaculum propionicicum]